ncbi:MAG: hypothetical protein KF869_05135 [Phycisphaeraceae bacterium]|nr:hypothetical protein [Phycisphaeraceae bacterium]
MTKWTYIDSVILRDRDIAASRKLSKGSLLPGRRGEVPERSEGDEGALFTLGRADVSAIFDNSGAVIEWQKYSAYGVPFLLTPGDHGKDGVVNSADEDAFDEDYTVHGPRSKQRDPCHVKAEERRRPCHQPEEWPQCAGPHPALEGGSCFVGPPSPSPHCANYDIVTLPW